MDLQLKISVEGKPEKPLDLVAYVFDRSGKLVSSSPVKADQVKLAVPDAQTSHARVFIAPAREGFDPAKASLQDMTALKAYEPVLKIQPGVLKLRNSGHSGAGVEIISALLLPCAGASLEIRSN